MIKSIIKKRWALLSNPEKGFKELRRSTFERSVADYLKLLGILALVSGIYNLLVNVVKAVYFDIFLNLEIKYWYMVNYAFGKTTSIMFFYLFAGVFILIFLSFLLKVFFRKMKYTQLLQTMFISLTPLLFFGWITILVHSLFIWSFFLFYVGVRSLEAKKISKNSISQRD